MSPCLVASPFTSAAVQQGINTNQRWQIQNKDLGKRGWGIGNNLLPRQRSTDVAQPKYQSSPNTRSKISGHASDCVPFSSIILPDHD